MKIIDYIIIILFLLFGLAQYNDPDFYIWVPVYAVVALIGILKMTNRPYRMLTWIALLVIGAWALSYIPNIVDWIEDGMPNIAGSMKAESPFIEFTREFFGLILCGLACIYFLFPLKSR